jgi:pimeloyl-ACP methyl ester carboxylesterase
VPRPQHVRDAFAAAVGLPPGEQGRRTLPLTFSAGWAERNRERFQEILGARLEHPTAEATIETHIDACYAFYARGCEVERIAVPTLVVHGDEDLIIPVENGRMLASRLPNARYVELTGVGHNLQLEVPERFNELVLGFLAGRSC